MPRYWRCRRISQGQVCGELNMASKRKCYRCGKPRPPKRRPKHMAVLAQPYEWWTQQFGTRCMICGVEASATRKLDRDHCHRTGEARGVLCHLCNRALGNRSAEWLKRAAAYLEQHEARKREVA